jgi:hypothetical protein
MSEDTIERLMNKIDNVSDRLARVETILEERSKSQNSYVGLAGWIVTTGIAIYAVVH